jgi:hypothetical protein
MMNLQNSLQVMMSGASNSDVFKLLKNTYTSIGCVTEEPNIAVRVSVNSINTDF